jgi:hypothetical protein
MNSAVQDELNRQQEYSNQAKGVFSQSLLGSQFPAVQQSMASGQQQFGRLASQAQQPGLGYDLPSFGAANTQQQATRNMLSNQAMGGLQGYQTYGLNQYLKDLAARTQLGVIGNEARQSASVMPYEVQAAQNVGQGLRAAGSLLGAGGGLLGIASLVGGNQSPSFFGGSDGNPITNPSAGLAPFYLSPMYGGQLNALTSPISTIPPIFGGG